MIGYTSFGNTIQIMYARVTRPLEQRARSIPRVGYARLTTNCSVVQQNPSKQNDRLEHSINDLS